MNNIEVRDSDDSVLQSSSIKWDPANKQPGHTYYEDVDPSYISGGTYDGVIYTPAPIADTTNLDAWEQARSDVVESDPNNIAAGDAKWKRCIIYNHMGKMDPADWAALLVVYPQI